MALFAENKEADRAFNKGCDARLAGRSKHSCPFAWARRDLREAWFKGWNSADREWGSWVLGRWAFPALPEVAPAAG